MLLLHIKAIETEYNGYRFRSRLEARWAVFFDVLKIPYRYEMEGFTRNGINYLPDFWFPGGIHVVGEQEARQNIWAEVKPSADLTDEARNKIVQLVKDTGNNVLLLTGDPGPDSVLQLISYASDAFQWNAPHVSWADMGEKGLRLVRLDVLKLIDNPLFQAKVAQSRVTPRLMAAYTAARQARFDRFESGAAARQCESCGKPFMPKKSYHRVCLDCYIRERRAGMNEQEAAAHPAAAKSSAPTNRTPIFLHKRKGVSCVGAILIIYFSTLAILILFAIASAIG